MQLANESEAMKGADATKIPATEGVTEHVTIGSKLDSFRAPEPASHSLVGNSS